MGFGADMMLRPRRPRRLQHRDDHIRHLVKINRLSRVLLVRCRAAASTTWPASGTPRTWLASMCQSATRSRRDRPACLSGPFGQGGLLVEPPPHLLRRVPAMVGAVGAEQLGVVAFDALPAFREHGQQVGRDAVDLPDRPAAGLPAAGAFGEGDTEPGAGARPRSGCCTAPRSTPPPRTAAGHPATARSRRRLGPCSTPRHGCGDPGRRPGSPSDETSPRSRPVTSICACPRSPVRVNAACVSSQSRQSLTAAVWASKIACRVASDPIPHSTATDFTGVNTRS